MNSSFANIFRDLPVLVTGHTGFKGSWLTVWLRELGARVVGFSLPEPPTTPSSFQLSRLGSRMTDERGDVRDLQALRRLFDAQRPEVVFHLAAQPLVPAAYEDPKETFDTNVGGTVNLLEAVRASDSVRAVVCVTTDKVYENREWVWGYRENDRLGGHDPYSASKAMAELAVASFRRSYFGNGLPAVATARAGNVIGGGDFTDDRLLPDCMRALMAQESLWVGNPLSVRPWQHVLESLSGYLWLATRLLQEGQTFAEAWNFAPHDPEGVTAGQLVEEAIALWGSGSWRHNPDVRPHQETGVLRLNWDKAANRLGWRPVYDWREALAATVEWFKQYQQQPQADFYPLCASQIEAYTSRAQRLGLPWASGQTS